MEDKFGRKKSGSRPKLCEVYIDGACRGNPGPAASAYIIKTINGEKVIGSSFIGISTNNKAEYMALVNALNEAKKLGCRRIIIYSDSQLLTKQLNNEYAVRSPSLKILNEEAKLLMSNFESVKIIYIPREKNLEADSLASSELRKAIRRKTNYL